MKGDARSRRRRSDESRSSSVESFSESAVKKQLRSRAMRHPATVLPFALCIVFIIILIVPPFLEPLWAVFMFIVSGIVSAGSFFWRYVIRYEQEYARVVEELMERHESETSDRGETELQRLREEIQTGFSRVNSVEGLKALQELVHEYEQLQPVLDRGRETDPMAVAHVPGLAEETYRQGLGVLVGCLDLMRETRSPNNKKLEAEVGEVETEIESMKGDETQGERLRILEATVASHKERLDLIKQQELRVDGLLHQSDSCEASLHRTRIELAALRADNVDASISTVTDTLERTINQAKEVREELRRLGY